MFALPLIAAPFLLCLVPYRLFRILQRLLRGETAFSAKGRPLLPVLTIAVYAGLAVHTAWLLVAIARHASLGQWSLHGLEPVAILGSIYPISYVVAEWVFFYGLKRTEHAPTTAPVTG